MILLACVNKLALLGGLLSSPWLFSHCHLGCPLWLLSLRQWWVEHGLWLCSHWLWYIVEEQKGSEGCGSSIFMQWSAGEHNFLCRMYDACNLDCYQAVLRFLALLEMFDQCSWPWFIPMIPPSITISQLKCLKRKVKYQKIVDINNNHHELFSECGWL